MVCAICGDAVTEDGARVLQGKAVCSACVLELTQGGRAAAPSREGGEPEGTADGEGESHEGGEGAAAGILRELNSELARLGVAEEDLGPSNCTVARAHGALFQLTDGCSSAVASGEKLLERLQMLPDGAGEQATWWMLADL